MIDATYMSYKGCVWICLHICEYLNEVEIRKRNTYFLDSVMFRVGGLFMSEDFTNNSNVLKCFHTDLMHINRPLFSLFSSFQHYKIWQMTGFEPLTSDIGSDRSANRSTKFLCYVNLNNAGQLNLDKWQNKLFSFRANDSFLLLHLPWFYLHNVTYHHSLLSDTP